MVDVAVAGEGVVRAVVAGCIHLVHDDVYIALINECDKITNSFLN